MAPISSIMVHKSSSRPYRDIWANIPLSASRRSVGTTCVPLQEGVGLFREAGTRLSKVPRPTRTAPLPEDTSQPPDNAGIPQLPPKNCEYTSRGSPCLQGLAVGAGARHRAWLQGGLGSEAPQWGLSRTTQHSGGLQRTHLLGLPQNQTNLLSPITKSRVTHLAPQPKASTQASQTQRHKSGTQTTRSTEAGLCLGMKTLP